MLILKPYRIDQKKFSQVYLLYPTIDLAPSLYARKEI